MQSVPGRALARFLLVQKGTGYRRRTQPVARTAQTSQRSLPMKRCFAFLLTVFVALSLTGLRPCRNLSGQEHQDHRPLQSGRRRRARRPPSRKGFQGSGRPAPFLHLQTRRHRAHRHGGSSAAKSRTGTPSASTPIPCSCSTPSPAAPGTRWNDFDFIFPALP